MATKKICRETLLATYRAKRDFTKTAEPSGAKTKAEPHRYLIQKHAARRLHYDFRLEMDGVLKSWAVTRGPSLNPNDKRLAVHVEDHPLDYGDFEGTIPQGQYGGGTVMLWDEGSWEPIGDPQRGYKKGHMDFELHGARLKGRWHLVRMRGDRRGDKKRENWLLIKGKDRYANEENGDSVFKKFRTSVISHRKMEAITKTDKIWKSNTSKEKCVIAGITITHPDKVLYPDDGITKKDLAQYYATIAPRMLPYVVGRPISLLRCPEGEGKQCFFQRHGSDNLSPHVKPVRVKSMGDNQPYLMIEDIQGLLVLAQMGVLEIHVWGTQADKPESPDRIVFDLDPAPDVAFSEVKKAALDIRDHLKQRKLGSFIKTTGGKGLHVVVPFNRGPNWDMAKIFARKFAELMAEREPNRFTINSRKNVRKGKIYIDYLRNGEGASAIAPYSTRARKGAPVAMPLEWSELASVKSGSDFILKNAAKRLKKDPWKNMAKTKQKLPG